MLLLVTLALVVASAVLLILGFVQDALGFIYLSMLCAGVAALALFVFARLTKRRSAALAGAGVVAGVGSPYMSADEPRAAQGFEPTSTVAVVAPAPAPAPEPVGPEPRRPEPAPVSAMVPAEEEDPWAPEDSRDDWGDEILFPIEDYDELRVAEILPLLGQLEPDELQEVRDRELAGKARATILDRIDDRLNRRPAAVDAPASIIDTASLPAIEAAPEPAAELAPAPAPRKRTIRTGKPELAEEAPAKRAPAARKATRAAKAAKAARAPGPSMATEPAPAPAKKAPAARAAAAKANPTKAVAAKTAAKAAGAAANSANAATQKAAAPAKKAVAKTTKTTKTVSRATPAKRAAKKSQ